MPTTGPVLVTGASGFLGAHVVSHLRQAGIAVVAGVRADSDLARLHALAGQDAATALVDMEGEELTDTLSAIRPDAVIHCAAYGVDARQNNPDLALRVNVLGLATLMRAAADAGAKRFVQVGTCYELGHQAEDADENLLPRPGNAYGASKASATLVALERGRALKLPTCVIRPFGMYGPLEGDHKLIPMAVRALSSGERLGLTSGRQVRDYCHVSDIADLLAALGGGQTALPDGEIIHAGSGQAISIRELVDTLAEVIGAPRELLRWGELSDRPDGIERIVADTRKARKMLAWRPRVGLRDGLAAMVRDGNGSTDR